MPIYAGSLGGNADRVDISQAGVVEDRGSLVANHSHDLADGADRFLETVGAALIGGLADARHQRQRPLDQPDDLAEADRRGRSRQPITAHLPPVAGHQPTVLELQQDDLEEFARQLLVRGDRAHRHRRDARGAGQEDQGTKGVTRTLGQHDAPGNALWTQPVQGVSGRGLTYPERSTIWARRQR